MNKKGDAWEATNFQFYVLFSIPLALAILFIFIMVGDSTTSSITEHDEELEEHILVSRILNTCFAYHDDDVMRTYPVIDLDSFNRERLNKCMNSSRYEFLLDLRWEEGSKIVRSDDHVPVDVQKEFNAIVFDGRLYNATLTLGYVEERI
ncbi:MAG: hypothetical protein ACQEP1_04130 [Nanobdellota archaeon]